MPVLPAAKKAEAFAALLDGSPAAAGGHLGTGQLDTLGALAQRLSSVPQPRPDFTAALRAQLISEATSAVPAAVGGGTAGAAGTGSAPVGAASTIAAPSAVTSTIGSATAGVSAAGVAISSAVAAAASPVWMPFTAFVAATAIAISGVAAGASISLPGDPLYGVKRQVETIQQELAGGAVATAKAQLGFAAARLDEFVELVRENGDAPLSADLDKRLLVLLRDWAGDTSDGTTVLLRELSAGKGDVAALRGTLVRFTDSQARGLAAAVQQLPDAQLQSFTGSAFAYLQRIDTALGNPVQVARLLPTLGLALPTVTSGTTPSPSSSASEPSATSGNTPTNPSGPAPGTTPTSIPTLPIPTAGRAVPKPSIPSVPLPTNGSTGATTGQVGGTVSGTAGAAGRTIDGVLDGVTGNGPTLQLPTTVPAPGVAH